MISEMRKINKNNFTDNIIIQIFLFVVVKVDSK